MKRILVVVVLLALFAAPSQAQDLDTVLNVWQLTQRYLGQIDYSVYDTTDLRLAINDGIRRVACDIGVVGYDTITIVGETYFYALNTNFIPKGLAAIPYNVFRVSADGDIISGLKEAKSDEFGISPTGTTIYGPSTEVVGYVISGTRIWIYPASPAGDKIYVEGPIYPGPLYGASTVQTAVNTVPDVDRTAVVYWAVSQLARQKGNDALAADFLSKYINHVASRGGTYMGPPAQVATGGQ